PGKSGFASLLVTGKWTDEIVISELVGSQEYLNLHLPATLLSFDSTPVPTNGDGDTYPSEYNNMPTEGGLATFSIDSTDSVADGNSLKVHLTDGKIYAQFNPYNSADNPAYPSKRGFARDYSVNPLAWQFNTYDRMSFWIKLPASDTSFTTNGSH